MDKKFLKIVGISSIGGGLEMYDFVIYAFFAPVIGKLFFPVGNNLAELLSAFAVFAIGYLTRPLGAFVFGHFGDTAGRKKALTVTILLMALATFLIGCLPTYQHIGLIASILLILLRLLQGFAVGGDLPGAITFVAEHVSPRTRGLHCSWIYTGVNLGLTIAAVVGALITAHLSPEQVQSFGWRIGFWFGLVLAAVGYYLRTLLEETPNFQRIIDANISHRFPLVVMFKTQFSIFLKALGIVCLGAVIVGHMLFMPSFLHIAGKLTLKQAMILNTCATLLWSLLILLMGYCSDRWGRKKVIIGSALTLLVFSHSLFTLIASGNIKLIIIGLIGFAIFMSGAIGAFASTLSELFPTATRNSGIGAAYNVGFALFCSVTPLMMTALLSQFGVAAPSYWIILAAIITLITTLTIPETARCELPD